MNESVIRLEQIKEVVNDAKGQNKKIVLVGGCFDIIHFGHIKFLQAAKKKGDILIIALESDENVKRLKGPKRPFHTQGQRANILSEIRSVDFVLKLPSMDQHNQYLEMIYDISPWIIATTEGDVHIDEKREQAQKVGAKFEVIPKTQTYSTSELAKLLGLD